MKKTRGKRVGSFLMALIVLCGTLTVSSVPARAYAAHTRDEAVAWARDREGTADIFYSTSVPGKNGLQCVDLIANYYKFLGEKPPVGFGYAKNLADSRYVPASCTVYPGENAQPGDIAVWDAGVLSAGSVTGHTGIVLSSDDGTVTVMDYNGGGGNSNAPGTERIFRTPTWVIRPDFKPSATGDFWESDGIVIREPAAEDWKELEKNLNAVRFLYLTRFDCRKNTMNDFHMLHVIYKMYFTAEQGADYSDPLHKLPAPVRLDGRKTDWLIKNIFHLAPARSFTHEMGYYYRGDYYWFNGGVGNVTFFDRFLDVTPLSNGKYLVSYQTKTGSGKNLEKETLYLVTDLKSFS